MAMIPALLCNYYSEKFKHFTPSLAVGKTRIQSNVSCEEVEFPVDESLQPGYTQLRLPTTQQLAQGS